MVLNNVKMQYQSDPDFKDLIMCQIPWQRDKKGHLDPDTIGEFFCRNTAELNMFNLFNVGKKYIDIGKLNELIIKHNGYYYLYHLNLNGGDIDKTYKSMEKLKLIGKESYVIPAVINWILGIKEEIKNYSGEINIKSPNEFYMIKTPYGDTGHYSMIYKPDRSYIDSYDGNPKKPLTILDIIKVVF